MKRRAYSLSSESDSEESETIRRDRPHKHRGGFTKSPARSSGRSNGVIAAEIGEFLIARLQLLL